MARLRPISLSIEGETNYRVRFQTEKGEVEHVFKIEETFIPIVVCDKKFLEMADGDPAAKMLKDAICLFHEARNYKPPKDNSKENLSTGASSSKFETAKWST
ncbi:MAG: hypothetical protein K2X77_32465 [Candidatus Obscuribacterales bacterium]|jgi:hypothetical protein|nr:hypothetical protein [Candidatus Obscuribacterales bacterium]